MISDHLYTCDNQFGFKKGHGTDSCIFSLKEIVNYYHNLSSPVFICFLDASKAFDRINHWRLFKKLIDRNIPLFIVRLIVYWYRHQVMNVRWGNACSTPFLVQNGVKQGGILSPLFFSIYMDDLSIELNNSGIGCHFGNVPLNHFIYADDMSLVAPSAGGLQKLIRICERYALAHDVIYNIEKSVCMLVNSKKIKLTKNPVIELSGASLKYLDSVKYLGCFITSDLCDDSDIDRQRRVLLCNANRITRNFSRCSEDVKLLLFRTFCANMYGAHLWSNYKKAVFQKLKVSYHNALRWLCNLSRDCSASGMLVTRNLPTFDALRRNYLSGFMLRLRKSNNVLLLTLISSTQYWYFSGNLGPEVLDKLYV